MENQRSEIAMSEITFRTAWRKSDPDFVRDVKAFWSEIGVVMTPEEMEQRAGELCALAYAGGRVAAVSTVHLFDFARLRSRFFYYRTTVGPDHRRKNLASRLCVYSRDRLAEWSHAHPEEKVKGLFIVIQAEEFRHRQHVPIATQLDLKLVLVGYTPNNYQLRIIWFPDASVE
jgi:hypothetical protein